MTRKNRWPERSQTGEKIQQHQRSDKPSNDLVKSQLKCQPGVLERIEQRTMPGEPHQAAEGDPPPGGKFLPRLSGRFLVHNRFLFEHHFLPHFPDQKGRDQITDDVRLEGNITAPASPHRVARQRRSGFPASIPVP